MDKRLFYLLNAAQHKVFKYADAASEDRIGLSVTQSAALLFIAKNEGCLQKSLASATGLNQSAITGLVNRMIKNKLIIRKPCKDDARASRLHLSKYGHDKLPSIYPLIEEMNENLTRGFSISEIETVTKFLNHIMTDFD